MRFVSMAIFAAFLVSCSTAELGGLGGKSDAKKTKSDNERGDEGEIELETSTEPVDVAGAHLTCAKAEDNVDETSDVTFGCGFFDSSDKKLANQPKIKRVTYDCGNGAADAGLKSAQESSKWQTLFGVESACARKIEAFGVTYLVAGKKEATESVNVVKPKSALSLRVAELFDSELAANNSVSLSEANCGKAVEGKGLLLINTMCDRHCRSNGRKGTSVGKFLRCTGPKVACGCFDDPGGSAVETTKLNVADFGSQAMKSCVDLSSSELASGFFTGIASCDKYCFQNPPRKAAGFVTHCTDGNVACGCVVDPTNTNVAQIQTTAPVLDEGLTCAEIISGGSAHYVADQQCRAACVSDGKSEGWLSQCDANNESAVCTCVK